jgi:preprotein translocase subunit YajC|tara:strand:+ start:79 stop:375 length:297 start_codon:yes stop_codon:yes gene_type:complete
MDATGSPFTPLIFLFSFMVLLYFMSIRPQQKRAKELQNMMDNLEKGDEVIAASGILGKVKEIKGDYVAIEVSENITFKLQKNAISNTLPKGTISSINK